jgi:hypothetical protein
MAAHENDQVKQVVPERSISMQLDPVDTTVERFFHQSERETLLGAIKDHTKCARTESIWNGARRLKLTLAIRYWTLA